MPAKTCSSLAVAFVDAPIQTNNNNNNNNNTTPPNNNYCPFCPDHPTTKPDVELLLYEDLFGIAPTCEYFDTLKYSIEQDSPLCEDSMIQFANYYCGCGSQPTVLGANTRDEQLGLLWARRTACVVAIVVSHSSNGLFLLFSRF